MPKRDFRGSKRRRRGKGKLSYAKKRRKGSKLTKIFTDLYSGSTTKGTKEPGKGAGTTVKAGFEDQSALAAGKTAWDGTPPTRTAAGNASTAVSKGSKYKEVSGVVKKLKKKRKKRR